MTQEIYCVTLGSGDEGTGYFTEIHSIYANKDDAETEITRLELIKLEIETFLAKNDNLCGVDSPFSDEDKGLYWKDVFLEIKTLITRE